MPDSDVSDVLVFAADIADSRLQAARKAGLVCLELYPTLVKLSLAISLDLISSSLRRGLDHLPATASCHQ